VGGTAAHSTAETTTTAPEGGRLEIVLMSTI